MIHNQHDHADRSTHHDVQQINEQRGQGTLHKDRFDKVVRKLRPHPFESIPRKLFNHRHGDSCKDSSLDDVHRVEMEGLEQTDKQQHRQHDAGQSPNHDRLNRIGKGADQLLHGQRDDKGKEPNGQGIRKNQTHDFFLSPHGHGKLLHQRFEQALITFALRFFHEHPQ